VTIDKYFYPLSYENKTREDFQMVIQKEKITMKKDKTQKPVGKQKECNRKVKDCLNCKVLNCPEEET
jgi:hypothetical protein